MKSFSIFISEKYADLSPIMRALYPTRESYQRSHLDQYGTSVWLANHVNDATPTVEEAESLVETQVETCGRNPKNAAEILASVVRVLNVTLPEVEGLLTTEYWEDHFTLRNAIKSLSTPQYYFEIMRDLREHKDFKVTYYFLELWKQETGGSDEDALELQRIIQSRYTGVVS